MLEASVSSSRLTPPYILPSVKGSPRELPLGCLGLVVMGIIYREIFFCFLHTG